MKPEFRSHQSEGAEFGGKIRLLAIDDEPAITDLIMCNLESTGRFEVFCERNPMNAVKHARKVQPDIILLDICMPYFDGGEVSRLFNQDPALQNIPVIFMSSLVTPRDADDTGFANVGGDRMMPKPVQSANLIREIDGQLARAGRASGRPRSA